MSDPNFCPDQEFNPPQGDTCEKCGSTIGTGSKDCTNCEEWDKREAEEAEAEKAYHERFEQTIPIQNPYKSSRPRYYLVSERVVLDRYIVRCRHTNNQFVCRKSKPKDVVHFEIKGIKLTKI